jgi:hypothetical protein
MITIEKFKIFCFLVKTEKENEIRKYYIKLESLLHEMVEEEKDKQTIEFIDKLKEKDDIIKDVSYEVEKTKVELQKERDKKNWLLNRRFQSEIRGDVIYLYKDNLEKNNSLFKIGKTKDIAERELSYSTMSKTGAIIYIKYCYNCDLTEKVIHHMLDKHRIIRTQEFFTINEELAKQVIDCAVSFLDTSLDYSTSFIPTFNKTLTNVLENNTFTKTEEIISDTSNTLDEEYIEENIIEVINIQDKKIVNPSNFDKFLEDCCELNLTYSCPKDEIRQAFRVWSKGCVNKEVVEKFKTFCEDKFKNTIVYIDDVKRNCYKGLKLKPFIFTPKYDKDYENFVVEKCKVDYLHRVSYVDFFHYFVEWKKETEPYFKLTIKYKKEIQIYLENIFAGGRVHLSDASKEKSTHLNGIWGIGLPHNNYGSKEPDRKDKMVGQYDINTKQLLKSWKSLTLASRELDIPLSTMSMYTRFNTPTNDSYFKYIETN